MGRWTQYDEDAYRLPAGMVRIGYDADTGQYIFRDRTGTYMGEPGSRYGPMFPASGPAPRSVLVADDDPPKTKRRATLSSMPNALRSLRRSLTAVRTPWRRDQNPSSDDEEPVIVSRPSSAASGLLRPAEDVPSVPAVGRGSIPTSKTSRSTERQPPQSAAAPPPPGAASNLSKLAATTRRTSSDTHTSSPPPPPPKPASNVAATTTRRTSSAPRPSSLPPPPPKSISAANGARPAASSRVASTTSVAPSRSVSTSAAQTPRLLPRFEAHARLTASEHVHASRSPIATRRVAPTALTDANPKRLSSPSSVATGAATTENVRSKRRPASEQTSSSPPSARSASTASSFPRTSAHLSRSLSTAEAPRTSRTIAMALAP
ncbi:hypothetical protein B0H11DRAFT_2090448 [Mycena galericulata]|nr:hypothetical protein B0H11DRAFT_2090448 [Mycena galericulata]